MSNASLVKQKKPRGKVGQELNRQKFLKEFYEVIGHRKFKNNEEFNHVIVHKLHLFSPWARKHLLTESCSTFNRWPSDLKYMIDQNHWTIEKSVRLHDIAIKYGFVYDNQDYHFRVYDQEMEELYEQYDNDPRMQAYWNNETDEELDYDVFLKERLPSMSSDFLRMYIATDEEWGDRYCKLRPECDRKVNDVAEMAKQILIDREFEKAVLV